MELTDLPFYKLDPEYSVKPFDCGDEDLNDFLFNEAKHFQEQLLATTYLLEDENKTIAFFSILNDSLNLTDSKKTRSAIDRMLRSWVPHPKRHLKHYPAIKIGRLAVCSDTKSRGLGSEIVEYITTLAISHNEQIACKFITVDAYAGSVGFYEKMGFLYLTDNDLGEKTRQMYLHLAPIIETRAEIEATA